MARGGDGAVLRGVHRLFGLGTVSGMAEGQLLDRFVSQGDDAAFEALVARHGPMVLGVCRQMLRDPNDVDDAFQATFLVLVRRAGSIRRPDRLGPWLYGVAYRVSVRARRHSSARRALADDVADAPRPCEAERRESAEALHQEVARLPEPYRAPVVLCYLEGLTHDDAAARLGWPVGTVRGRLARARDRLRDRLARRGLAPAEGPAAMVVLLDGVRAAVPERLAEATVRTATGKATAGLISSHVLALAEGVMQAMLFSKLKVIATALVAVAVVAAGTGVLAHQGRGPDPAVERPGGAPEDARRSGPPEADTKRDKPRPIEIKARLHADNVEETNAEQREDERSLQMDEARALVEFLKIEANTAKQHFQRTAHVLSQWELRGPEAFPDTRGGFGDVTFPEGADDKAKEKQVRNDFEKAKALYLGTQAKLRREERRLAQLEREAGHMPVEDVKDARPAEPVEDARFDELEKTRGEAELLRLQVAAELSQYEEELRKLKNLEASRTDPFMASARANEPDDRLNQMLSKQARVLEEMRRRYLEHKLKLGQLERSLARLERELARQPGFAKAPSDVERRLSEIEAKLNRLLESSEGKKTKTP
jgi:RNA polymerase sigma factor (sigma-70 family)